MFSPLLSASLSFNALLLGSSVYPPHSGPLLFFLLLFPSTVFYLGLLFIPLTLVLSSSFCFSFLQLSSVQVYCLSPSPFSSPFLSATLSVNPLLLGSSVYPPHSGPLFFLFLFSSTLFCLGLLFIPLTLVLSSNFCFSFFQPSSVRVFCSSPSLWSSSLLSASLSFNHLRLVFTVYPPHSVLLLLLLILFSLIPFRSGFLFVH